jgi:hypothetical protein
VLAAQDGMIVGLDDAEHIEGNITTGGYLNG